MIEHLLDFIPQFEMQIKLSKYIKSLYTKANIDSYFVNSRHPKNNFKQNLQKVGNTGPLFQRKQYFVYLQSLITLFLYKESKVLGVLLSYKFPNIPGKFPFISWQNSNGIYFVTFLSAKFFTKITLLRSNHSNYNKVKVYQHNLIL